MTLTVTDLGGSDSALPRGAALAVSEGGRIVGNYSPGSQAAEFHEDGTVTRLPTPPGYVRCSAVAVTDDGVIAGTCTHDDESTPLPRTDAVYWDAARVVHQFLGSDPALDNEVRDMNANGVILGSTSTGDLFTAKAWTYDVRNGQLTQLPGLPNAALVVNSINDRGDIVGTSISAAASAERRPFKLSGTPPAFTMLAAPLGCTAGSTAINNGGVIAGPASCGLSSKPVIWSSATAAPEDLPLPPLAFGYVYYSADVSDVSDTGIIVAQTSYGNLPIGDDVVVRAKGIAWTPERAIVDLDQFSPAAVNNAGLIVGTRGGRPATAKWSPYVITSPTNGVTVTTREVSIVFSAVSGGPSEPGTTCQLDSAPPSPCTSPHTYAGLVDGPHTVTVTPSTSSGDVSQSAIVRFAVVTGAGAQVKQVTASSGSGLESHTCAVLVDGRVRCWGSAGKGQLGYGNTAPAPSDEFPTSAGDVNVGGAVVQITAGNTHTCALLSTGNVRCWGNAIDGRLGYGNTSSIGDDELPSSAGDVNVGGPVVQIAAGRDHTCALLSTGNVRCWGNGSDGRLGYENTTSIGDDELPSSAGDVNVGGAVVQLAAGRVHTCALLSTGNVRCWGNGTGGRLGYGNTSTIGDDELPSSAGDVNVGGAVVQIAAGGDHTCALLSTGNVRCWGSGGDGRLGYGNTSTIGDDELPSSAGDVNVGGAVVQIAAGHRHTCAQLSTGSARCWGRGVEGQLGYGNMNDIGDNELPSSAGNVNVGGAVAQIVTGSFYTCALLSTRSIRCWGDSSSRQLGYFAAARIGDDELPRTAGDVPLTP